jgi:hypothetical protein
MDQKRITWQVSQASRIKKILDILTKIEEDSTSKRGYRPTLEERQKIRGTLVQAAENLVNALTPKEPLGFTFEDEERGPATGDYRPPVYDPSMDEMGPSREEGGRR